MKLNIVQMYEIGTHLRYLIYITIVVVFMMIAVSMS